MRRPLDESGCAVEGRMGEIGDVGESGPSLVRDAPLLVKASRMTLSWPMGEDGTLEDVDGLWPFRADSSMVDIENGRTALARGRSVRGRGLLGEWSLGGAHVTRGGGV